MSQSPPPTPRQQPVLRPERPATPPGLLYTILRHTRGLSHEDAARQVEAAAHEASLAA